MPIYEYRCEDCRKLESIFLRSFSDTAEPVCSRCGSRRLRKLVSRFYSPRSEDDRLDALADPSTFADVDENDPRSVARWAKRLAAETGEDMGDDFREMVDMLERGAMPEEFEGAEGEATGMDDFGGYPPGMGGFGGAPGLPPEEAEGEAAESEAPVDE